MCSTPGIDCACRAVPALTSPYLCPTPASGYAACTPSSLLVHYMNAPVRLWDRIGEDGVLRDCGDNEPAAYCWLPPFSLINHGKAWPGGPIVREFE